MAAVKRESEQSARIKGGEYSTHANGEQGGRNLLASVRFGGYVCAPACRAHHHRPLMRPLMRLVTAFRSFLVLGSVTVRPSARRPTNARGCCKIFTAFARISGALSLRLSAFRGQQSSIGGQAVRAPHHPPCGSSGSRGVSSAARARSGQHLTLHLVGASLHVATRRRLAGPVSITPQLSGMRSRMELPRIEHQLSLGTLLCVVGCHRGFRGWRLSRVHWHVCT